MKMNKGMKILLVAMIVAVTSSVYGCSGGNKAAEDFKSMLQNGSYPEALSYYSENKDAIGEENTAAILKEEIENIYNSYTSGKYSAPTATDNLNALSNIAPTEIQKLISDKKALIESNENYKNGEKAFADKNYDTAKDHFMNVIESDPNYAEAKKKITECDNERKKVYIEQADKLANDGDYSSAANMLKSHLSEFENVDDLNAKITEYVDAEMETLLKDANQYIKNGDYYSALEEMHSLEEKYSESAKLKKLEEETQKKYLEELIPLIDEYTTKKNYIEAYAICKNALDLIPESNELKTRLEKLEPLKPVLLSEMKISESEDFEQLTDHKKTYEDVVGNKYEPGNLYQLTLKGDSWSEDTLGYAKVFLNSQYKKCTGTIAVSNESEIGDFMVKILCDDKEVYSGNFNRTTPPQKVSVDVKGKKWLQVLVAFPEGAEKKPSAYAFLSNFGFEK